MPGNFSTQSYVSMQYLFYGRQVYVHWVYGSLWWIHMVLLTPKHVEIQCFGLIFSTANQWEVTKTIVFISTITAYI